jgi:uncharacterized protein YqgV (UPF0045/DUF77 family)
MEVSCQFALYPLGAEHLSPAINAAVAALERRGLTVEPGSMSSIVSGPIETVFAALAEAFTAAADGGLVLVATVSNACPAR